MSVTPTSSGSPWTDVWERTRRTIRVPTHANERAPVEAVGGPCQDGRMSEPTVETVADPAASTPSIKLGVVVLDTPDPAGSAAFYGKLLGVEVSDADDDWVTLDGAANGLRLAFQLAPNLIAPTWPDGEIPQQFHLDLHVENLDAVEKHAVSIGARPVEGPDPSPDFRTYLDPAGHPFCLCRA
jgi:catechol 2,3-dioxygenase-like lactoylglutathione lyase family enzyme